jgi:hypothetical protein
MVKRKLSSKPVSDTRKISLDRSRHEVSAPAIELSAVEAALEEALQRGSFESEQEALDFCLQTIVSKFAEDEQQRTDMYQFLELLLETDTELREHLLSAVAGPNKS